jgi:hypothetical protein
MSLLHKPTYTNEYTLEDDNEGLGFLLWSQFGCKCGKCSVSSGKDYMERLPILILDDIAREERMRFDVLLAYVCEKSAYKDHFLPTKDSHRVGLAVKIRVLNTQKRLRLVRGLILRGVTRIGIGKDDVYFDCDDLKEMSLFLK